MAASVLGIAEELEYRMEVRHPSSLFLLAIVSLTVPPSTE